MKFFNKNWPLLAVAIISAFLGVLVMLTVTKLRQEQPIAPTAPEKPKALEGSPVPACQVTFTITLPSATPSPTPTRSPSPTPTRSPSPTPTRSPSPTPTRSPSPTPTRSPSPTPTSTPPWGGWPTPSPTPTPTPTATPAITPTPTPTASPVPQCNDSCTTNATCPSNLICYIPAGQTSGYCRNPSCQTDTDCICEAPQPTPTPGPSVIPEVPRAGVSWPTIFLIMGGLALLVLGFALP